MAKKHPVIVIGGTNIDIIATATTAVKMYDSTLGNVRQSHGGVGRNVVENLARLGVPVTFITVIGEDAAGRATRDTLSSLGVQVMGPTSPLSSSYVALHQDNGDMMLAINDMHAMNRLTPEALAKHTEAIQRALVVVLDANVPVEGVKHITKLTKRTIIDAVSTAKVTRLKALLNRIDTIKLNHHEAAALVGHDVDDVDAALHAAMTLIKQGLSRVYLTMGASGVVIATPDGAHHHLAPPVTQAKANGAGDAFTAGIAYGRYHDMDELPIALEMARLTLRVDEAVYTQIKDDVDAWVKKKRAV